MKKIEHKLSKTNNFSTSSIKPYAHFELWATKQGGRNPNWKKRYFMGVPTFQNFKPMVKVYYFKSEKEKKAIGIITVTEISQVKLNRVKKGSKTVNCVCISSGRIGARVFRLVCKNEKDQEKLVIALNEFINSFRLETDKLRKSSRALLTNVPTPPQNWGQTLHSVQTVLSSIPNSDISYISELWALFSDRILNPTIPGLVASFSISADLTQISWRAHGHHPTITHDIINFFNSVGSPDLEIDRLNDLTKKINPSTIGATIEMSTGGGLDGRWYFPHPTTMENALKACDSGEALTAWTTWTYLRGISHCTLVSRDMGSSLPRPTEIRVTINRESCEERMDIVQDCFRLFEFPEIPEMMMKLLVLRWCPASVELSVVFCSEGYVRVGVVLPRPDDNIIHDLCVLNNDNPRLVMDIKKMLFLDPEFVEIRFLGSGYGYDLTKEGLSLIFHFPLYS